MPAAGRKTVSGVTDTLSEANLWQTRTFSAESRWGVPYTQADPLGYGGGANFYSYSDQNPLRWIDPLGLCAVSPDMQSCLNEIFGADTGFVGVYGDTWWIRLFPDWVMGTTLPGEIHFRNCAYLQHPSLVLHEYYHVMRQWPTREYGAFSVPVGMS